MRQPREYRLKGHADTLRKIHAGLQLWIQRHPFEGEWIHVIKYLWTTDFRAVSQVIDLCHDCAPAQREVKSRRHDDIQGEIVNVALSLERSAFPFQRLELPKL